MDEKLEDTYKKLQKLNDPTSITEQDARQLQETTMDTTPVEVPEVVAQQVPEYDTMSKLRDNIQKYQDKANEKRETKWQDNLPDILSAAHNIINYSQGSQQKMLNTDNTSKAISARTASKKEDLSQLQNLQKMYQDYRGLEKSNKAKGMTEYQKAQLDNADKDRELKERLAKIKDTTKAKVTSFVEKETIKADLKEKMALQKENRSTRKEAEESLKDIDKNIANVKKAAELMRSSVKSPLSDTGPIDQFISPMSNQGQKLRQTFNEISLDKMTKMFAGMSKAIDSDAERKFFEQSQVSMGSYPEVNMGILSKMLTNLENLKSKNQGTLKSINKKGEVQEEQLAPVDSKIEKYASDHNLDYNKAEAILIKRGYNVKR